MERHSDTREADEASQVPAAFFLRLDPVGAGGRVEVPLAPGECDGSALLSLCEGQVLQAARYRLALLAPVEFKVDFASAILVVNGEDIACERVGAMCSTLLKGDAVLCGYEMRTVDAHVRPFGLTCGYVRMQLELLDGLGRRVATFRSQDVLCRQDTPASAASVEAMVESLVADPAGDCALGWMISDGAGAHEGAYSLLEGGYVRGASRSVPTYFAMVEAGLAAAEAALPTLRSHAAGRIQHDERMIDSSRARRFGTREARWMAAHPEILRPAVPGRAAVMFEGRPYEPVRLSATTAVRSLDVYENQICVSYLLAVANGLSDFEAKLQSGIDAMAPQCGVRLVADPGRLLIVSMARVLQSRQRAHLGKAAALRERALRLLRQYQRVLVGVKARPLGELRLVRTKAFKEIRAYSQLFAHIERFQAFGESIGESDGLAIAALRLDKAYETYVLYRLLRWLADAGYAPAEGTRAIYAGRYGHVSDVFGDTPHVANVYRLQRADTTVELYYEPVAFADEREGHNMSLHRLAGQPYKVFTPDYVLVVRRAGVFGDKAKRVFVLDAKYRSREGLLRRYADGSGRTSESAFDNRAACYVRSMVDAETGRLPDALWLLSGLEDDGPDLVEAVPVPWCAAHPSAYASGVALVTPSRGLDELFAAMGLAPGCAGAGADKVAVGEGEAREARFGDVVLEAVGGDGPVDEKTASSPANEAAEGQQRRAVEEQEQREVEEEARRTTEERAHLTQEKEARRAAEAEAQRAAEEQERCALALRKQEQAAAEREEKRRRAREKQVKREERVRKRKEGRVAVPVRSGVSRARGTSAREVEELVREIIDTAVPGDADSFFDAVDCQRDFGINQPLLRTRAAKDYLPLSDREGVFFYCPKLPTYVCALKRYLSNIEGGRNRF